MVEATLCFILDGNPPARILLGLKKKGFGNGKYNGVGGKILPGESLTAATIREVREEVGLILTEDDLRPAGSITFHFPFNRAYDHHVHVFIVSEWHGMVRESEEMAPAWFAMDEIPFQQMWQDDAHWLPLVLAGKQIEAEFTFANDNETVLSWRIEDDPAPMPGPGKR